MEGHRVPVRGSIRTRGHELCVHVSHAREFEWATAVGVDPARPTDPADKRCGGQELSGLAIEHVKEAILICLEKDFSRPAIYCKVSLDERLRCIVIEAVAGRSLEIPSESPVLALTASMQAVYRLSPSPRRARYHVEALPVPKNSRSRSGS